MRRAFILIGIYLFVITVMVAGYAHGGPTEDITLESLRAAEQSSERHPQSPAFTAPPATAEDHVAHR